MKKYALRGQFFTFKEDPFRTEKGSHRHLSDGLMIIEKGKIIQLGEYKDLAPALAKDVEIKTYDKNRYVIIPGFLDTHVHYPQIPIVGAYGKQLIDWLNNYTFVFEQNLSSYEISKEVAKRFLAQSIKNGVTTSFVYSTVYKNSVDALFEEAQKLSMRLGTGKILMDRNAPPKLCDTPESSYQDSEELLLKWHNKDRLMYVITPRFAPTSSPEQLKLAGELWKKYPDVYI